MPDGGPKVPIEPKNLPILPEVRVKARRRGSGPSRLFENMLRGWNVITGRGYGGDQLPPGAVIAFVAPPLATPIDEIVVTAKAASDLPKSPAVQTFQTARAARGLGWLGAIAGGIYALDWYAKRVQREEDEARAKYLRDAELQRLAEQMSVDVTVTARRPAESVYTLPPLPQFQKPDPDFEVLRPIIITEPAAAPATLPEVEIAPITAPAIQPSIPAVAPRPGVLPELLPYVSPVEMPLPGTVPEISPTTQPARRVRPSTEPLVSPQPSTAPSPSTSPQVQPFTSTQPATQRRTSTRQQTRRLTRRQREVLPLAEAMGNLQNASRYCKPCDEEKDKPRTQCWKKLVKEHMYPELDEEYEWVRIDCLTGREL